MVQPDNPKYNQIVETARELFWRFGIKRITIEEICQKASVSKMTFYKYFSNKIDLVKTIVQQIMDEAMGKYRDIMNQDNLFEEKVRQSINLKMEKTDNMSNEFFNDYYLHADPELSQFLHQKIKEGLDEILKDYTAAQKRGEIRKDIKPEFIVYFLNQMLEMAKDEKLLKIYHHPQYLIMEITTFFFYGIMNRTKKAQE